MEVQVFSTPFETGFKCPTYEKIQHPFHSLKCLSIDSNCKDMKESWEVLKEAKQYFFYFKLINKVFIFTGDIPELRRKS